MTFTFFDITDKILFVRSDAEQAEHTHEQMSLYMLFPYDPNKVIERGMRVGYRDNLGVFQVFEIRKCTEYEPDHYQEITAEHIVISELSDEIRLGTEFENITAQSALSRLLDGTIWQVGTTSVSTRSSANLGIGNVWADIRTVEQNWNVRITPRVTVGSTGITGRYLDITNTNGTWRGLRLSVDKNMESIGVTLDDSNLKTACYGFGKLVTEPPETMPQRPGIPNADPYPLVDDPYDDPPDPQELEKPPLTFAEVTWEQTVDHPAKPDGQTYIEDPVATEAYGRNGRARFTFYQNGDIEDPEILLQKTWEYLQSVSVPEISIDSAAHDLSKLGCVDVPIRLHDIAIIEIRQTGRVVQKQVIKFNEDLLNPANNQLTIGSYIPNIVYINRDIAKKSGAGGGGGGGSYIEEKIKEFETEILWNDYEIGLRAYQRDMDRVSEILRQAGIIINANGVIIYAEDNENNIGSKLSVLADRITTEVTDRSNADVTLSSRITQTAESITSEVTRATTAEGTLSSRITQTAESITALVQKTGVNNLGENETLYSKITQTAEAITSEVTRATTAEGTLSSRITQTATDITSLVTKTGVNNLGENETLYSQIQQTATDITSIVSKTGINNLGQNETLYSEIQQTATDITTLVTKTGVNSLGQNETLYSEIQQNATAISSKVSAGDIASTINQTAQSVLIQASKIDLQGYVTATELSAVEADITRLTAGTTVATALKAGVLQAVNGLFLGNTQADYRTLSLGNIVSISVLAATPTSNKDFDHYHDFTMSESNGVITITSGQASATAVSRNFNIAATQFYIDAVAAAQTTGANSVTINKGTWSNGQISFTKSTGTASTQSVALAQGSTVTWGTGANANKGTVTIYDVYGGGSLDTGATVTINAQSRYDAGEDSVTAPVLAVLNENYLSASKEYEMDVYCELTNGYTRTGYAVIDASDAWNAGKNSVPAVTLNAPTWSATTTDESTGFGVSASNGASVSQDLYLTRSTSWVSGTRYVYLRTDSSSGTQRARIAVYLPSVSEVSWNWDTPAPGYIRATISIGGNTYSSSHAV